MAKGKINKEENEILASVENGEWKSLKEVKKQKKKFQKAAVVTLKEQRINIRLPYNDLRAIKEEAIKEGLPYQTLIKSILHKFVNGTLIRK